MPPECSVASSDLKISVESTGLYTYPDVSVVCGPFARDLRDPNALTNPRLVVEVLSRSTEDYDPGAKLAQYQTIPTVQAVLFVSHQAHRLTLVARCPEGWQTSEFGPGECLRIGDPALELSVDAVYSAVS